MPIPTSKQYGLMQGIAHGTIRKSIGPSKEVAEEMIHKTPARTRSRFAKQLGKKRKKKENY